MHLLRLFPLACTSIALLLSYLAIFAGTHNDMMENYDLVTFNVSRIGVDYFKEKQAQQNSSQSSSGGHDGLLSGLVQTVGSEIHNVTDKLESELESALSNVTQSIAREIGLHDFYSIHVLNHCEGYWKKDGKGNETSQRNVTYCSGQSNGISRFNLSTTLERGLNSSHVNVTLSKLHWPQAIDDAEHKVNQAFSASFAFLCLGIIFESIAWFACMLGLFADGRWSAIANVASSWVAVFALIISNSVLTWGATMLTDVVNKVGKDINVNASRGNWFLSLTWTPMGLMVLAGCVWLYEFIRGKHWRKVAVKEYSSG